MFIIIFGCSFIAHTQIIVQGKDLPAKDLSGTSDPYVRVTLLPDKKHRLETKIKRRTLNPRWNETFYFEGFPIQKLNTRVLHLHVFDYDRFSRDDSIGEVFLPLCQVSIYVECRSICLSYNNPHHRTHFIEKSPQNYSLYLYNPTTLADTSICIRSYFGNKWHRKLTSQVCAEENTGKLFLC